MVGVKQTLNAAKSDKGKQRGHTLEQCEALRCAQGDKTITIAPGHDQ